MMKGTERPIERRRRRVQLLAVLDDALHQDILPRYGFVDVTEYLSDKIRRDWIAANPPKSME